MIEETIRKQSTIAALSNASILHDPTLVEDLSELRSLQRIINEEDEESVSGSVVITKRVPPTNRMNTNVTHSNNDNNVGSKNKVNTNIEEIDSKQSRITSFASSNYSSDSIQTNMNQVNTQDQEHKQQLIPSNKIDLSNKDNIDFLKSKLDKEMSTINSRQKDDHYRKNSILDKQEVNEAMLKKENDDENSENDGHSENDENEDADDNDYDLNMEYSDSDFEDNLEQRMMHLDIESDVTPLNLKRSTTTPLQSGSTTPTYKYSDEENNSSLNEVTTSQQIIEDLNINNKKYRKDLDREAKEDNESKIITDNDNSNEEDENDQEESGEEEEEEGEFEDEEEYQSLPPPQELDPDKLYALYAFNGPDPSHCQLEQDEACILLNDEDAYWWLVKRCKDNNIGFAPAEILETFPERLARLNCWKNENMTSSAINSLQSLDMINQSEKEQQETLETKKSSNLKLPYKFNKNEKSVSFSNIVSYANRYFNETSENEDDDTTKKINNNDDDDSNGDDNYTDSNNKIALKIIEDKKVSRYSHIDEFTNEVISYKKRDDFDENNGDIASDVSFNTGYSQPLNIVKIRESKSIKNIHDEIVDEKPKGNETENEKSSDIQGLGIKELNLGEKFETADPKLNSIKNTRENNDNNNNLHNAKKGESEKLDGNSKHSNSSTSDLHKIFEAPIVPFGENNSNKMKESTSDYSISTIGEFSPSSSEWTNDSPSLKNIDNINSSNLATEEKEHYDKSESSHIPSTKAVRNISKLVKDANLSPKNEVNELENTLEGQSDDVRMNESMNDNIINNDGKVSNEFELSANKMSDNTSTLSTESNTVSSINNEFEIYMDNKELQMSTTSVASYNSLHKNQKNSDMSNVKQISDNNLTIDYTEGQYSTTSTIEFKHPLVQKMYNPILNRIDILMNQIDDIIRR